MPLNPQAQALIDRIAAAGYPPLYTHPAHVARAIFEKTSVVLDARDIPIGSSEDRKIPGPGGAIPIRILRPVDSAPEPAPAIVFFHGGGFVLGSVNTHDVTCRLIANATGMPLISVDYRLAPEHKFPAGLEDCIAATQWVCDHAEELGLDPGRIAVAGDSAGGNLAAVVAQVFRDKGHKPSLAYQLLIYPATDAASMTASKEAAVDGYLLDVGVVEWFNKCYVDNPDDWASPKASPLRADDLSNLPPAYVVTAGFDPLRDEGAAYAAALREAGVEARHVDYEGMLHGFFNMTGVIDESRQAIEDAAAALRTALL